MAAQIQNLSSIVSLYSLVLDIYQQRNAVSYVIELKAELIPFLKQDSLGGHLSHSDSSYNIES